MHDEAHQDDNDAAAARLAAAIGEPARARMLYCLLDGHARTSTELAAVAAVSASTASVHLNRLRAVRLVEVQVQGKHRYYRLAGPSVARALEALSVLAGGPRPRFEPRTPSRLRAARTCYDHLAGGLGVALLDRFLALRWVVRGAARDRGYDVTPQGAQGFAALGLDVASARGARRRFAYACLDWSERRPHLGGALAAAVLALARQRKWVVPELDSRGLEVTAHGRRQLRARLGVERW